MKKHSMRAIPAAAAMMAALVFGVQVHAQTSTGMPPGTTNPKDASTTAGPAARTAADGNSSTSNTSTSNTSTGNTSAGKPTADGTTMPPGSTKPKDALNTQTSTSKSAEQRSMAKSDRASAKADKRAARTSKKKTDINNSAETAGGSMGSTAASPSK